MVSLAARPFIDVRASFNSFLPSGINPGTAEKLVNAWLSRLDRHPEFHDKIEFEIASTAFDFTFEKKFSERYPGLLSASEFAGYRDSLKLLTSRNIALGPNDFLSSAEKQIETLRARRPSYAIESRDNPSQILTQVHHLLDDCRTFGTVPFSILARHAFIAEALLRSATERQAVSGRRIQEFKQSIATVTRDLSHTMKLVSAGELPEQEFWQAYGHLRPGTYDITSLRYLDRKNIYDNGIDSPLAGPAQPFGLTSVETRNIDWLLRKNGFGNLNAAQLFEFAARAIRGREYAKLIFTWNLSTALEYLVAWGQLLDLGREEVSFIPIDEILGAGQPAAIDNPKKYFAGYADNARSEWTKTHGVKLGYLIRDVHDLYVLPEHRSRPNFITNERLEGNVFNLETTTAADAPINGMIACIENADPGFDWIFTKGIAGLVTKFGGVNSHMAVRCMEFGLPAAIGCGEDRFNKIAASKMAKLDCANKTLIPIHDH